MIFIIKLHKPMKIDKLVDLLFVPKIFYMKYYREKQDKNITYYS